MYAGEKEGEMVIVALLGARSRRFYGMRQNGLKQEVLLLLQAMNSRLFISQRRIIERLQKIKSYQKTDKERPAKVASKKKLNKAKATKKGNDSPAKESKKQRIKLLPGT